jgi:xanthine dehydrogenase accessory factor
MNLSDIKVIVKSGGDLASGVAWRLHHCGMKVLITEIPKPLAVRRTVSFCEAVYSEEVILEGVRACLIDDGPKAWEIWDRGDIPVIVDPDCRIKDLMKPRVLVDAILAKENIGTSKDDAPLVIALGPGFTAGVDAHYVVETNRGHHLGRLLLDGGAEPNTGKPGAVMGITFDRVLRAPDDGEWKSDLNIGDFIKKGDRIGAVNGIPVTAAIDGVIRGMIHPGIPVRKGLKIGDIDPRGIRDYCFSISEKALAIGGGVLEGILRFLRDR